MPQRPDEPLTKVTFNMFTRDLKWFQENHSENYTEAMRRALRKFVNGKKMEEIANDDE